MISYILGFKTSENIDETVVVLMSIFTPRQPRAVKYDYAAFIENKIHEQFMKLDRERVFKYTSYIYHCCCTINLIVSKFLLEDWTSKEK